MAELDSGTNTSRAERLATAALAALVLYLLLVTALDTRVAGVDLHFGRLMLCWLVSVAGLRFGIRQAVARRLISGDTLLKSFLLAGALLISLLMADAAVSAYLGLTVPPINLGALSRRDRNSFVDELYPRLYYPTDRNFRLHKPGVTITGSHYGDLYLPAMLQSPTLVDSVLRRKGVSIHINELGFRESSPLKGCEIFTLGDSFTFGWGITEGASWPDLLERRLDRCVYNLGIHDSSPFQELVLLEHVLSLPEHARPQHVVWAIFEGNDLEDSYDEKNSERPPGRFALATKGTILDVKSLAEIISTESVVHRLRTGELRLVSTGAKGQASNPYQIDGVTLVNPLFHSPQLGYLMAESRQLRAAAQSREYVLGHPNRARLDKVFAGMARLRDSLHLGVTVMIIPSSVRFYAPYFPLTPAPSPEPYFVNYVAGLAAAQGFDVVNLLEVLQPYAKTEFLYFRDDDHLNERGHELVAAALADHLKQAGTRQR